MRLFVGWSIIVKFLVGCEPSYRLYVRNKTLSDVYLKTTPTLDSLYPKWSDYQDTLQKYKIQDAGAFGVYKIKPQQTFKIFGKVGGPPRSTDLPFQYLQLIHGNDTITLNSKEQIIRQLKKEDKSNYFIDIKK